MHILSLPEDVELTRNYTVKAGTLYAENQNGAQLLSICGDGEMRPLREERRFMEAMDWNNKRILLLRTGGFGDLVLLTPVISEIKRRWPTAIVDVCCIGDYAPVFENNPDVHAVIDYPLRKEVAEAYNVWCFYEKAIEKHPDAHFTHATDLFAKILGFDGKHWSQFKQPKFFVSEEEKAWAKVQFPRREGIKRLFVQGSTSSIARTYSSDHMSAVLFALQKTGEWEVMVAGKPDGEINFSDTPSIINLTNRKLTFRQSCAVLEGSDVMLGSDSALLHVAGALNIPAVGLYGPFAGKLRTAYCPETVVIQAKGKCAPCFHHSNPSKRGTEFPAKCPSREKNHCQVLDSIKPDDVLKAVKKAAKK